MAHLKNSKVFRGGVTAPSLSLETRSCSTTVDQTEEAIEFDFQIASKGGGTTKVVLQVGKDDLLNILQEVANKLPSTVSIFSECTTIAHKRILEQLESSRKVKDDEKGRARSLIDSLELVEEFVKQKFYEVPAGEDEYEARVREQLQDVMNTLRELR